MNQNLEYEIIKFRDKSKIKIPKDYYNNKLMAITRKTFNKFPWGHLQTVSYGDKRIGKTIYYIKTMMEQQRIIHPEWDKDLGKNKAKDRAFKEVMDRTYFTINEFSYDMKKLQDNDDYVISCHIDDAGCGFNKYKWFTQRPLVEKLKEIIDTIGIVVVGLYFSSPTLKGILGFLKEYESYRIHITSHRRKNTEWDRMAKIYRWTELPSGMMRISAWPHIDQDPFSCYLENKYFERYWGIRRSYLGKSFEELGEIEKQLETKGRYDKDLRETMQFITDRLSYASDTGI